MEQNRPLAPVEVEAISRTASISGNKLYGSFRAHLSMQRAGSSAASAGVVPNAGQGRAARMGLTEQIRAVIQAVVSRWERDIGRSGRGCLAVALRT